MAGKLGPAAGIGLVLIAYLLLATLAASVAKAEPDRFCDFPQPQPVVAPCRAYQRCSTIIT